MLLTFCLHKRDFVSSDPKKSEKKWENKKIFYALSNLFLFIRNLLSLFLIFLSVFFCAEEESAKSGLNIQQNNVISQISTKRGFS